MNPIDKLAKLFSAFPGVGPRQSRRFVYFLLTRDASFRSELSRYINELADQVTQCTNCFRFFPRQKNVAAVLCDICNDPHIDHSTLLIVEKDADLENVKKTGVYRGNYFVLGGSVPLFEEKPEGRIRVSELENIVKKAIGDKTLKEVIFALSATPEGDHTIEYLREQLSPIGEAHGVVFSVLGRGLSTGTELEYSDTSTLENALKNRSTS